LATFGGLSVPVGPGEVGDRRPGATRTTTRAVTTRITSRPPPTTRLMLRVPLSARRAGRL